MALSLRLGLVALLALAGIAQAQAQQAAHAAPALRTLADLPQSARPAGVPEDYVVTPNGFFHASCVVQLEEGDEVLATGGVRHADGSLRKVAACAHPHYGKQGVPGLLADAAAPDAAPQDAFSGWLSDSNSNASVTPPAGKMTANWIVPSAPANAGSQVLYFFPGLEASPNVVTILQPVLGWNSYGTGVWTMANWNCCKDGSTFSGPPIPVNVGDKIVGKMIGSQCSPTQPCANWQIVSTDVTTGQSTTFSTPAFDQLFNWYFGGVMEVYGVSSCNQLPANGSITFKKIVVRDTGKNVVTPVWSTGSASGAPSCAYKIDTTTNVTKISFDPTL